MVSDVRRSDDDVHKILLEVSPKQMIKTMLLYIRLGHTRMVSDARRSDDDVHKILLEVSPKQMAHYCASDKAPTRLAAAIIANLPCSNVKPPWK